MDKEQFFVIYFDGEGSKRKIGDLFDTYNEAYDAYCTAMDAGFSCCKICKTIYG